MYSESGEAFDLWGDNHDIQTWDYVVIGIYFVTILGVGFWSSKISKGDSVSGYFLADKSMHWITVGGSLFASNMGSGQFIGLAGSGASSGLAIATFEFNALFILLLLGWIFLPTYTSAGVYTMPEYLRMRFGGQRIRVYLSILALILYIFTKISVDLYAGALFVKLFFEINLYVAVGLLLVISAVFTIGGGLTTVMWTDFVQTVLMVVGSTVLAVLSEPAPEYIGNRSDNTSCSAITPYYRHFMRPADDPDLPWTGMIFGVSISATWYWCTDQVIVQRGLCAKNTSHAKGGCILAAFIKLLPLYIVVMPGMASRMLWPDEVGCSNHMCKGVCGSDSGCTNIAYLLLVLRVLPQGLTGLMFSVMMAALISSLTSIFNSASTIFTIDLWKRVRSNPGDIELIIVGRMFVVVLAALSILWIPLIETSQNSKLFDYIQSVTSYLAPPVCAVYVLGVLWPRVNEKGAFWGLMIGFVIGMIRFIMEMTYAVPSCASQEPDPRPAILSRVHYLNFGILLFGISCIVIIAISLLTQPIDPIHLHRLTFWTRFSEEVRVELDSKEEDVGIYNVAFNVSMDQVNTTQDDDTHSSNVKPNLVSIQENTNVSEHKKWLYTICCFDSKNNSRDDDLKSYQINESKMSKEEEAKLASTFAKEVPLWQNVCNIMALFALAVGSFIWGLYA